MDRTHRLRMIQTVFMAAVLAFPFLLPSRGNVLTGNTLTDVHARAKGNLPAVHADQRLYSLYRQTCRDRMGLDASVVCPDYRDKAAVQAFLNGEYTPPTRDPETGVSIHTSAPHLELQDLSDTDQQRMRWYQDAHVCPSTLQNYLPGFYELCQSLVSTSPSRQERRGIPQQVQLRLKGTVTVSAAAARRAARLTKQASHL